jgi:hypothetical protein
MVAHFEWPDMSSLATLDFPNLFFRRHPERSEGPLYLSLLIARLTEPVSRKPQRPASLTQRTILARQEKREVAQQMRRTQPPRRHSLPQRVVILAKPESPYWPLPLPVQLFVIPQQTIVIPQQTIVIPQQTIVIPQRSGGICWVPHSSRHHSDK